jgi:hypothetical protein
MLTYLNARLAACAFTVALVYPSTIAAQVRMAPIPGEPISWNVTGGAWRADSSLGFDALHVSPYVVDRPEQPRPEMIRARAVPDYRWEGAVVGGITLGVGLAVLTSGMCDSDSGTSHCGLLMVGAGLVGGTVGVVTGGFIGSLIPKRTSTESANQGVRMPPPLLTPTS